MTYSVKEIHYTLQGEGAHAGRPAVFLRFTGCNLWTGRESDRAKGPGGCSRWCDTDFVGTDGPGGGRFANAEDLAATVRGYWRGDGGVPYVVCTGGEPLLQLDSDLVAALKAQGFTIAIETNGTQTPPAGIDWICVSPKPGGDLVLNSGDELKLVYPQQDWPPSAFTHLPFSHFMLQPMDGPNLNENTQLALRYCLEHPQWRLSIQTHKIIGIP